MRHIHGDTFNAKIYDELECVTRLRFKKQDNKLATFMSWFDVERKSRVNSLRMSELFSEFAKHLRKTRQCFLIYVLVYNNVAR